MTNSSYFFPTRKHNVVIFYDNVTGFRIHSNFFIFSIIYKIMMKTSIHRVWLYYESNNSAANLDVMKGHISHKQREEFNINEERDVELNPWGVSDRLPCLSWPHIRLWVLLLECLEQALLQQLQGSMSVMSSSVYSNWPMKVMPWR